MTMESLIADASLASAACFLAPLFGVITILTLGLHRREYAIFSVANAVLCGRRRMPHPIGSSRSGATTPTRTKRGIRSHRRTSTQFRREGKSFASMEAMHRSSQRAALELGANRKC